MARASHARDRAIIEQMLEDVRSPDLRPQGPPEYVIRLARGVRLRFEKAGGMLILSMLIDETTSRDAASACWESIAFWRKQLADWQGPSTTENRYIAMLARWHGVWRGGKHAKPSAADLASWVNTEVAGILEDFWESARHEGQAIDLADLLASAESVPVDNWAFGLSSAVTILKSMGLSPDDIRAVCEYAIENLQSGRPACLPDYPVTRHHVASRLKTYRRQQ
jgi:hypothetical protein